MVPLWERWRFAFSAKFRTMQRKGEIGLIILSVSGGGRGSPTSARPLRMTICLTAEAKAMTLTLTQRSKPPTKHAVHPQIQRHIRHDCRMRQRSRGSNQPWLHVGSDPVPFFPWPWSVGSVTRFETSTTSRRGRVKTDLYSRILGMQKPVPVVAVTGAPSECYG